MEIEEVDPADPAAFDAWFGVFALTDAERWPGRPGWQRAERLAMALDREGPEEHKCLLARDEGGAVLGIADLEMYRRENGHVARMDVRVRPEQRRRGVGSAIVTAAKEAARASGRTELGGMDEKPTREGFVDAAGPFAIRLGFAPAQQMVRRELDLPKSESRFRELEAASRSATSGYDMETFTDRWPDADIDDRCELGRRMSTDVPIGEQELDEEVWDEARVRHTEAKLEAMDRSKVTTAAREERTGRLIAYTEVVIPRGAPSSAWQHDTLVMREHRGHRLGYAMKLSNALAVRALFPAVHTISTWNAAENAHMIAINDELGFEVVSTSTLWLTMLDGS
jgi:GNAT superfamily N-acetyltransferase